jgi:hypothetical protein
VSVLVVLAYAAFIVLASHRRCPAWIAPRGAALGLLGFLIYGVVHK